MIRELKWLLCCWGLCFVFFSHAGSECWMGPGPGPGLYFCPLKYSWIAFVVKWAALLCWFSQISMGRVYWAEIMCNWFVQCWCTEGKKKAVYTDETYPDWPQLIKKKRCLGKKAKKWHYVDTTLSWLAFQATRNETKVFWVKSFRRVAVTETCLETGGILTARTDPRCIHVHTDPFGKTPSLMPYFKRDNRRVLHTCFILCSGYKSCVCRLLHWPDGTRIIRFINGGLKSRLHSVKGACKQLNAGNSKVVFRQGDEGQVGMKAG